MRPGQSFEQRDVAEHYKYRPEYPPILFKKLISLSPLKHSALDLGCGTGKIARGICDAFTSVTAMDASISMLEIAQALQDKSNSNIAWVPGRTEEMNFGVEKFDLIVAAASIHWMDHDLLFPRLLEHVEDDHVLAVVDGDGAYKPPWEDAWSDFLSKWIFELTGEHYESSRNDSPFAKRMRRHRDWLILQGEETFEHSVSQSVDDFVLCQYSRDTFAPSKLGKRKAEFSEELRQVVAPYADSANMLVYRVMTSLEWGKINDHALRN